VLFDHPERTAGEQIFDPVPGGWVKIYSLSFVAEQIKLNDAVTTRFNDFVANGFLLEKKPPG